MAETTQQTQIAQELGRIKNAKELIGTKAGTMGLSYKDDENHTYVVGATTPIEDIADAIGGITVFNSDSDADIEAQKPTAGVTVNKNAITVQEGFHAYTQVATVKEATFPAPTITIDPVNGAVTATVTPTEGYVYAIPKSNSTGFDEIAEDVGMIPGNIKAGTTIFEIAGTFTSDATVPATGSGDVLESSHITKDFTAYKNGKMVMGTLENYDSAQRDYSFNPLETNDVVFEGPVRYGAGLTVGLSNDLLEALQSI
jgi:hypothetical protein